ncbi:Uncharacterized protein PECH_007887 [Penicillium ucsense]|uniref:deoxyribose-phosphate aldolase n=1 Tax=Penicillium ucsense TaxID=2839758 RepID=A0A8J8WHA3_9EURO|nr:Uncharacterized protein PECM_007775 [Penicillium ucsense]KAF7734522.1 Uncharacterized protein PECH_007887 [Penicillium ucsense]
MSTIPATNAEWAKAISSLSAQLPGAVTIAPASSAQVPSMIDHTLLKQPIEPQQIDQLCLEAREHNFATVCVRVGDVAQAVANLKDLPNVGVACVVGFHEGTYETEDKVTEAREAVAKGASELDMVIDYSKLKQREYSAVYEDVLAVRRAAPLPVLLKAILETSELEREEVIAATLICCVAGVDFVKTSTGFKGPATADVVSLMRTVSQAAGFPNVQVKASGGVRTASDCLRMVQAGATRIGASAGVNIVRELASGEAPSESTGGDGY